MAPCLVAWAIDTPVEEKVGGRCDTPADAIEQLENKFLGLLFRRCEIKQGGLGCYTRTELYVQSYNLEHGRKSWEADS